MENRMAKCIAYIFVVLVTINIIQIEYSYAQAVTDIDNTDSDDNIVKILGIDPTSYPKIKVNIFVDELCAATGDLVKDDFEVAEDGNGVAIDNFYFTGRASGEKLDLAVVFDETDTMADEIDTMQSKVDDLTNKIKSSNIDARYSLVTFKTEILPKIEWTDDADVFKREVDLLRASGGNYQRPEDSLGGVATALSFGFRPDAQKIIIVITDEPSMQRGDGWSNSPYHKDDVIEKLQNAGVMLVAVSSDFRYGTIPSNIPRSNLPLYADMRDLALNSGGLWIDIDSADFSVILDQLKDVITGTYVIEYTSPDLTPKINRAVTVSVNSPECVDDKASSIYIAPVSATVPNEPPVIRAMTPNKTSPQEADAIITWTIDATDPNSDQVLYRFFLDDEPVTDWTAKKSWRWPASDPGLYRVEGQVRDGKHAGTHETDDRKLASFEITGFNETEVVFPDPNLEAAVRTAIDKPDDPIYARDLEQIDRLEADGRDIKDITGLEYCSNLQYLDLGSNQINDVSPPAGLTNLQYLNLVDNRITDASPLAGLTNLQYLNLVGNQITDASPLAGLTNLQYLYLVGNKITDVSPLAGLTNLQSLYIKDNQITDVSPLAGLTNLEKLDLVGNQITDIYPLAGLTNLQDLYLGSNKITGVSPLAGLSNLQKLDLGSNKILDVSPLASLTNLQGLDLRSNQITSVYPLAGLSNLEVLDLGNNKITSASPLAGLTNLQKLDLGNNRINDVYPLTGLTNLQDLYLGNNKITSVYPLAGLSNLQKLDLRGNRIIDASSLAGLTAEISYND